MELKDSASIAYSAEPQVLTISILKDGVMDILKSLANMKLIRLETSREREFKKIARSNISMLLNKGNEHGKKYGITEEIINEEIELYREEKKNK